MFPIHLKLLNFTVIINKSLFSVFLPYRLYSMYRDYSQIHKSDRIKDHNVSHVLVGSSYTSIIFTFPSA